MKALDPTKYIDLAHQDTDDPAVMRAANRQWTDVDSLVNYILDYIPANKRDQYLGIVTYPDF